MATQLRDFKIAFYYLLWEESFAIFYSVLSGHCGQNNDIKKTTEDEENGEVPLNALY